MAPHLTVLAAIAVAAVLVIDKDLRDRRARRDQLFYVVLDEGVVRRYRESCQTLANILHATNHPVESDEQVFYRLVHGEPQPVTLRVDVHAPVPEPQHTPGSSVVVLASAA